MYEMVNETSVLIFVPLDESFDSLCLILLAKDVYMLTDLSNHSRTLHHIPSPSSRIIDKIFAALTLKMADFHYSRSLKNGEISQCHFFEGSLRIF
ncbi:hypothetical protein V1478_000420 [Vespula squamosa]|uniref:Maturase K n=1 Tax=Vespula squamosa TaxID=30214 RepID=A0ABD2C6B3_VESSQ